MLTVNLCLQMLHSVWRFEAQAGPPFGEVSFLLFQLRRDGARMVIVREVVGALQMRQTGFCDRADAVGAKLELVTEEDVRQQLQEAGGLEGWGDGDRLYIMRLSHLVKMLPEKPDHQRVIPLLNVAAKSKPPPIYQQRKQQLGDVQGEEEVEQEEEDGVMGAADPQQNGVVPFMPWEEEEEEEHIPSRVVMPRLVRAKMGRYERGWYGVCILVTDGRVFTLLFGRPPKIKPQQPGAGSSTREEEDTEPSFYRRGQARTPLQVEEGGVSLSIVSPTTLVGARLLTGQQLSAGSPVVHVTVNQQMSSNIVLPDYFPTTLPVTRLTASERRFKYGLGMASTPRLVKEQIKSFVTWSTDPVQLSRSGSYSAAVQFTTTEKHETCILAYLGYLANVRTDVNDERLEMQAYSEPKWIVGFISYLVARDVGRGHIIKHVALARKVNNWLVSGE